MQLSTIPLRVATLSLMLSQGLASPQPLSVPPAGTFIGDDGPWSGIELRVGTPPQNVHVFVSTTGSETIVTIPSGCQQADPPTCSSDRGGTFNSNDSTSWQVKGDYSLEVDTNLGLNSIYDNGFYGLDDLALGWQGSGLPTLNNQVIAGTAATNFWVGLFGICPYPTNLSGFNADDQYPTYLQTLRNSNLVPSLSWGYTAGAQYRLKGALTSLTFGGYDTSLFTPGGVSFDFGPDNNRDLVLYVQSIAYTDRTNKDVSLLPADPGPFPTFIDSVAAAIWLPMPACEAFEKAFGLTWNDTYKYYFVDEALHNTLTSSNPNVTFTLSNTASGGPTVNITLPYAAFDKTLSYGVGLIDNLPALTGQKYFPLQRAANSTQYTLGKTFLQEAYVIADYERKNFTVNPCVWNQGAQSTLVPICSINTTGCISPMGSGPAGEAAPSPTPSPQAGSSLGLGPIIGIVFGLIALIVGAFIIFICWRRRRQARQPVELRTAIDLYPDWPGHGVPAEAAKPHEQITEICSTEVAEIGGSSKVKLEYYGEHPNDEVHELPTDGGILRLPVRTPSSRPPRSRTGSTGQESSISDLSEASPVGGLRPNLSHRRNTSEQSKVSDASTLREDGDVSPNSQLGISPLDGSGFLTDARQTTLLPTNLR